MPGTVKKVLSIGGPHMGVMDIPGCISEGPFCSKINGIARKFVYLNLIQNHCGPCNYFRDTKHYTIYKQKA